MKMESEENIKKEGKEIRRTKRESQEEKGWETVEF